MSSHESDRGLGDIPPSPIHLSVTLYSLADLQNLSIQPGTDERSQADNNPEPLQHFIDLYSLSDLNSSVSTPLLSPSPQNLSIDLFSLPDAQSILNSKDEPQLEPPSPVHMSIDLHSVADNGGVDSQVSQETPSTSSLAQHQSVITSASIASGGQKSEAKSGIRCDFCKSEGHTVASCPFTATVLADPGISGGGGTARTDKGRSGGRGVPRRGRRGQ